MGFADLQAFLDRGGPVLLVIMLATFFMWGLILERVFYFRFAHKQVAADAIAEWRSRSDRKSTLAHWVKDKLVSEVRMKAEQNVQLTKAMVALAPLLGLLGTVTGMVAVFDIMAITSGADAKFSQACGPRFSKRTFFSCLVRRPASVRVIIRNVRMVFSHRRSPSRLWRLPKAAPRRRSR